MFERLAEFFKTRMVEVKIHPEIKVDFHRYGGVEQEPLREQWSKLVSEIDQGKIEVSKREKKDWGSFGNEVIEVKIDEVRIILEGPHYDIKPGEGQREVYVSPQEQADRNLKGDIVRICWDIQHASKDTAKAMIAAFSVAAGEDVIEPKLVDKVVEEVYRRIFIKKAVEDTQ